ncbi:hypothetical protein KJN74_05250 [Candidatus Bathyarchaeota archaeon]|nr:hypothetical protein [Candidatus Bathyarchaeota archaeon]
MSTDPARFIKDADFIFENMTVKIIANRNNPKIDLPGIKVGPFKEGKEYEVKFWIAMELKKAGIARIRLEEPLDLMILNKIHWKERVQTSQKLTSLPKNFYPKLRRYLKELNKIAIKKPEKRIDYEKVKNNSDDITQMRLKKIISLASSGRDQTGQILRSLTKEEKYAYDYLHKFISEWKTEILKPQEEDRI